MSTPSPRSQGVRVDAIGVGVAVGRKQIIHDVSLSIRPGEMVGLLGPSGCGKSTLLMVLSGQTAPSAGRAMLDGAAPETEASRALLGYVPQDDIVHGSLSVESALTYSARLRLPMSTAREAIERRVSEVIVLLGLQEGRETRVDRLSGGQRKRVSVGVELLTEPPLLFLDEPTAGLDPLLEEHMMDFFRRLADAGRTIILSTHILQCVDRLDLLCVLAAGRVAFFGSPAEALGHFKVPHHSELYRALSADALTLGNAWRASPLYETYVGSRLADRKVTAV